MGGGKEFKSTYFFYSFDIISAEFLDSEFDSSTLTPDTGGGKKDEFLKQVILLYLPLMCLIVLFF